MLHERKIITLTDFRVRCLIATISHPLTKDCDSHIELALAWTLELLSTFSSFLRNPTSYSKLSRIAKDFAAVPFYIGLSDGRIFEDFD